MAKEDKHHLPKERQSEEMRLVPQINKISHEWRPGCQVFYYAILIRRPPQYRGRDGDPVAQCSVIICSAIQFIVRRPHNRKKKKRTHARVYIFGSGRASKQQNASTIHSNAVCIFESALSPG